MKDQQKIKFAASGHMAVGTHGASLRMSFEIGDPGTWSTATFWVPQVGMTERCQIFTELEELLRSREGCQNLRYMTRGGDQDSDELSPLSTVTGDMPPPKNNSQALLIQVEFLLPGTGIIEREVYEWIVGLKSLIPTMTGFNFMKPNLQKAVF